MRQQREFRGSRLSTTERPKQPRETFLVDLRVHHDPARAVGGLLVDDRIDDGNFVEPMPEHPEIEQLRGDAQLTETFAGDRVTGNPARQGDPDDERLRAGGAGGEPCPCDLPPEHGKVGIEGALIDACGLGCCLLHHDRRPLLEVDTDAQPVGRVEPIEQATIEGTEGQRRLDGRGAEGRWHRETIAEKRHTTRGAARCDR